MTFCFLCDKKYFSIFAQFLSRPYARMFTTIAHTPTFRFAARLVLSLLAVVCSAVAAQAAPQEFVARFHYRLNYGAYLSHYMGNERVTDSLSRFLGSVREDQILEAKVIAYASPEGPLQNNIDLCESRRSTMKGFIENRFPQLSGKTSYEIGGEAWELFRQHIKADTSLQERSPETYRIIDDLLNDSTISNDQKKVLLKSRLTKDWYNYISETHFPEVRICEVIVRYIIEDKAENEPEIKVEPQPETQPAMQEVTAIIPLTDTVEVAQATPVRPVLGISTNLLYDAVITPNLAIELPLGKHWTVLVDYTFPWWVNKANDRAWEIQKWDLGARYWLGRKRDRGSRYNQLTGHFFGVDLGVGYYDIEPRHTGFQGEGLTAGLEYGYAWRLGKHWRMSAFIAAGWMGTLYRKYTGNKGDTKLMYDYDGRFTWMGPTKVGLSIQYVVTKKVKK